MALRPLEHIRILDFATAWAGTMPTMLLVDMGAQVIKIEPRAHLDPLRFGPGPAIARDKITRREDLLDLRVQFHGVNRGKLGLTLDAMTPQGAELVRELVKISDVVVDNYGPGFTQRVGLDYESLRKIRSDIICCSLSMVGQKGPYNETRGYAGNISGLSGMATLLGYPDEPDPASNLYGYSDWNTGETGALAILMALVHRSQTGEGQFIDISAVESTAALLGEPLMDYLMNGRIAGHQGNEHPTLAPHGTYPCKGEDAWVSLAVGNETEWKALCHAMGNPAWASTERFADAFARLRHRQELDNLIGQWTRDHTKDEVSLALQQAGVAAAPVLNIMERQQNSHFRARGAFVEVEQRIVGRELMYRVPWDLSETPGAIRAGAPGVGEHNRFVLGEVLGLSDGEIGKLAEQGIV